MSVTFRVLGKPQPAGSKKAYIRGKRAIVVDANPKAKPWKDHVAAEAGTALQLGGQFSVMLGAVEVELHFTAERPKSHYGTGRNADRLRADALNWPTGPPDVDKLSRACLDAMTGVVYRDDAQVVRKTVTKSYGAPEGVLVIVRPLLQAVTSHLGERAA